MSVPLSPTSDRRIHAARFGAELRRAMEHRGVSLKAVERATGISHTNLWSFKSGRNLPRLDTALLLTDSLSWPKLAELIRNARQSTCARPRCGRVFVSEGGNPRRYCSADCARIAVKLRAGVSPGAGELLDAVRAELRRVHGSTRPVSRRALKTAADQYATVGAKRGMRMQSLVTIIDAQRTAVDAFCRACEPDGYCKAPACELRSVSPLPIAEYMERDVVTAVAAPGPWGTPESRENQLAAIRGANARRWTPEERRRQSERTKARWGAMSPDDREAAGRLISERRRNAS